MGKDGEPNGFHLIAPSVQLLNLWKLFSWQQPAEILRSFQGLKSMT